ncbi:MAG: tetratricopeptide repeat protein [Oceanicaulis sp.]
MTAIVRVVFAGAALSLAGAAAQAQECPSEPVFVGVSSANSDVRASASRVERGDWAVAEHFATEALESGTSSRNKAAAQINLCAALANQRSAGTADACAAAIAMNDDRWEAYTNRGAAFWLAGDLDAAREDFARAAELGAGEEAVASNTALASCAG